MQYAELLKLLQSLDVLFHGLSCAVEEGVIDIPPSSVQSVQEILTTADLTVHGAEGFAAFISAIASLSA